ncbi:hypothetical protein ACFC7A_29720 [Streptomyces niveus]|uniref:hypothetical protein n=1 Tax=Streptomyces niveus TaxID=193462 RepID=UPI0035E04D02
MAHGTVTADVPEQRGLILDFAGVLTASPLDVHLAWSVSEGLAPGRVAQHPQRSPQGRRL